MTNAKKMIADLRQATLECICVPNAILADFGQYACDNRSDDTSLAFALSRAEKRIAKSRDKAEREERKAQERTDRAMRLLGYKCDVECDRPMRFIQVDERLQNEAMMRFAAEFGLFGESQGDEFICDDCGQHHASCLCR